MPDDLCAAQAPPHLAAAAGGLGVCKLDRLQAHTVRIRHCGWDGDGGHECGLSGYAPHVAAAAAFVAAAAGAAAAALTRVRVAAV